MLLVGYCSSKCLPDPGSHSVRLRRAKMNIEDNNCDTYTETVIGNYPPSWSQPPPEGIEDHGE